MTSMIPTCFTDLSYLNEVGIETKHTVIKHGLQLEVVDRVTIHGLARKENAAKWFMSAFCKLLVRPALPQCKQGDVTATIHYAFATCYN